MFAAALRALLGLIRILYSLSIFIRTVIHIPLEAAIRAFDGYSCSHIQLFFIIVHSRARVQYKNKYICE